MQLAKQQGERYINAGYRNTVTHWNARKEILGNVHEVFMEQIEGEPSQGEASLNLCSAIQNAVTEKLFCTSANNVLGSSTAKVVAGGLLLRNLS